jgi:hypothetical protein
MDFVKWLTAPSPGWEYQTHAPAVEYKKELPAAWVFPTYKKPVGPIFSNASDTWVEEGGKTTASDIYKYQVNSPIKEAVTRVGVPQVSTLETDPSGLPLNSPGAKADAGKLRPWLVLGSFSKALEEVSKVGTVGAKKYTPNGWITVENGKERYMDAAMRHLLEIGKGNQYDDGPTGIYTKHIANAIWNLLAVLELEEREE